MRERDRETDKIDRQTRAHTGEIDPSMRRRADRDLRAVPGLSETLRSADSVV